MTNGSLLESVDSVDLKSIAEMREGSSPSGATKLHLSFEERKKIPVECTNCKKLIKNCFALGSHKGWCNGTRDRSLPHLNGKRNWNKGLTVVDINNVFMQNSKYSTNFAKEILLKEGMSYSCTVCNVGSLWQNKSLTLELDHINGMSNDHRRENLRLLCPNCHSQTSTFRGRNKKQQENTKVSDDILLSALQSTKNIRQALILVGLVPKGGNYKRCYQLLSR
jgi:Zn finger protein HypA/HybF involved in hydrogenase expression